MDQWETFLQESADFSLPEFELDSAYLQTVCKGVGIKEAAVIKKRILLSKISMVGGFTELGRVGVWSSTGNSCMALECLSCTLGLCVCASHEGAA